MDAMDSVKSFQRHGFYVFKACEIGPYPLEEVRSGCEYGTGHYYEFANA